MFTGRFWVKPSKGGRCPVSVGLGQMTGQSEW
jgi:hypothetical protein